jgi:hypothetical protein
MLRKLILGRSVIRIEPLQLVESLARLADRVPPSGRNSPLRPGSHVTGRVSATGALGGDGVVIAPLLTICAPGALRTVRLASPGAGRVDPVFSGFTHLNASTRRKQRPLTRRPA